MIARMTGWQWAVAAATSGVEQTPLVGAFFHRVKDFMTKNGGIAPNHVIATRYKGGTHYIGWHSDKTASLAKEGWIVVFKFGAPRPFEIRMPGEAAFFSETLQPGDCLIMTTEANEATQHTVPKTLLSEPSGKKNATMSRLFKCFECFFCRFDCLPHSHDEGCSWCG